MIDNNSPRTIWVIDGAYLMKAAPGHFDYLKLKAALEKRLGSALTESYYLNSGSKTVNGGQDSFHNWLKMAPPHGPRFHVELYGLKEQTIECPDCRKGFERTVQKGVDVGIATLIIKLAVKNRYDRLLLAAGDGDLLDAVAFIRDDLNKDVLVCGFESTVSPDLQPYASSVIWLDSFWREIARPERGERESNVATL